MMCVYCADFVVTGEISNYFLLEMNCIFYFYSKGHRGSIEKRMLNKQRSPD